MIDHSDSTNSKSPKYYQDRLKAGSQLCDEVNGPEERTTMKTTKTTDGFRPVIPAADGLSYEIVPSGMDWVPLMDHECTVGPWFPTEKEARKAAEEKLEENDE